MPRTLTYNDLPVSPRAGELLKCAICDGEYSATQGDYFMAHPDDTPMCCDEPLTLVTRGVVFVSDQHHELPERYQDMRRENRRQNEHAERLMLLRRQQDERRKKGGR